MITELGKGKARLIVNIGSGEARRRRVKTVTYKTKKELRQMYADFEREVQRQPLTDITVEELLKGYITHAEALGRKAETLRGYNVCLKRLQRPLGSILARNLTPYHVEQEIASMAKYGLSPKTIKNTIGLLSSAFEHAIKIGQLEDNPCEKVSLPKKAPREAAILHRDEIQPFLDMIADAPQDDKVAYELALFMGLRRSEILGLRESDVDIIRRTVSVHNTRHRVNGEVIEQDTKTERSKRILAMPDILVMDIAVLLKMHEEFPYEKTDYLIQDGFGKPLQPQTITTRLSRLEAKYCMPHVTLHGLRHTYASLLNASGVDIARISAELGHSNTSTTMNIYTHIFEDASQSSRDIANTISGITATSVPQIED